MKLLTTHIPTHFPAQIFTLVVSSQFIATLRLERRSYGRKVVKCSVLFYSVLPSIERKNIFRQPELELDRLICINRQEM